MHDLNLAVMAMLKFDNKTKFLLRDQPQKMISDSVELQKLESSSDLNGKYTVIQNLHEILAKKITP
jgi:hypothetical protein